MLTRGGELLQQLGILGDYLAREFLSLSDLVGGHIFFKIFRFKCLSSFVSIGWSNVVPRIGGHIILQHSFAKGIHRPKDCLRICKSLFSSFAIPTSAKALVSSNLFLAASSPINGRQRQIASKAISADFMHREQCRTRRCATINGRRNSHQRTRNSPRW